MHLELTKTPERLVGAIEGRREFKDDALFGLEQPWCECHLLQWEETGGHKMGDTGRESCQHETSRFTMMNTC